MSKERVALRRAIAMGIDTPALVRCVYGGQALPANQMVPPGVAGHDPTLPAKPPFDPAGSEGAARPLRLRQTRWRRLPPRPRRQAPDAQSDAALRSGVARGADARRRRTWMRSGLRLDFHITPFQEAIKELEAGEFQMYFGGYGGNPSGYAQLMQLYGRQPPTVNVTRFRLPDYDREMERFLRSPDETEQIVAAAACPSCAAMYVPALPAIFRLENDFAQPWVLGLRSATLRRLLEVSRHRPRAAAAGASASASLASGRSVA